MQEKQKKERVQLDFSPEALARLDDLKEEIGATTRAETIRQALRLFIWLVKEAGPDDTITITSRTGEVLSRFKALLILGSTSLDGYMISPGLEYRGDSGEREE